MKVDILLLISILQFCPNHFISLMIAIFRPYVNYRCVKWSLTYWRRNEIKVIHLTSSSQKRGCCNRFSGLTVCIYFKEKECVHTWNFYLYIENEQRLGKMGKKTIIFYLKAQNATLVF